MMLEMGDTKNRGYIDWNDFLKLMSRLNLYHEESEITSCMEKGAPTNELSDLDKAFQ